MEDKNLKTTEEQHTLKDVLGSKVTAKTIIDSIGDWAKYHEGEVAFIGCFVSLKKDGEVGDELTVGFGPKETVRILMDNLREEVEKGKDFISM